MEPQRRRTLEPGTQGWLHNPVDHEPKILYEFSSNVKANSCPNLPQMNALVQGRTCVSSATACHQIGREAPKLIHGDV